MPLGNSNLSPGRSGFMPRAANLPSKKHPPDIDAVTRRVLDFAFWWKRIW
jgi:hypothetical protein